MKTPIATFERVEKDGQAELKLIRVYSLPKWYQKCKRYPVDPVPEWDQQTMAQAHQVCIKNVLPVVTPEEYKLIAQRSIKRLHEKNPYK